MGNSRQVVVRPQDVLDTMGREGLVMLMDKSLYEP